MTVAENLEYRADGRGPRAARRGRTCLNCSRSCASGWPRYPVRCRGGEQQMLAMARALCLEPRVAAPGRADGRADAVD